MQKRRIATSKQVRAASQGRARTPTAKPPSRRRRKASRLKVARTAGVAGARPGTVRGRSRKKPPRKAPARSKLQRQKRAERLLGFGGPILTR
jgi:hypothetical protein